MAPPHVHAYDARRRRGHVPAAHTASANSHGETGAQIHDRSYAGSSAADPDQPYASQH